MKAICIKIYIVLLSMFLFSSCSTLINKSTINVNIYADTDSIEVYLGSDSLNLRTLPTRVNVMRSKDNLMITAQKDTIQKQIEVKSTFSSAFILGNLFSGAGLIGYAIDFTNSKRFTYPTTILIKFNDDDKSHSKTNYYTWLNPQKNLQNIKISVPNGNYLYLNKGYSYGGALGFLGASVGFEYYFTDKYYLNMDFGGLTDFPIPFPAPIDYGGEYNRSFAIYGDIQIGSYYKRLSYDMGIQFTQTRYYERETVELFPEYIDSLKYYKKQNNLGLAFSAYYRTTKNLKLGFNYYPSFLVLENVPKFHYSHLLFFELSFIVAEHRPK